MRERGVQSRRVRPGQVEPVRRPGPPPGRSGSNFWQVLAILALVAATAGWTTAAVLALRPAAAPEALAPVESIDPNASDDTEVPPVGDTHDAIAMESLLPTTLSGNAMQIQSWNGDGVLTDDPWSASMTAFLAASCKLPTDLHVAQSYDPNEALDASVGVYKLDGVAATTLRDALIEAWKGDYPDMKLSQVTIGGKDIKKGDFGAYSTTSYIWIHGDEVYDIETSDETVATAALAGLPTAAASGAPVASGSSGPAASCVPASGSPEPAASPSE